MKRRKILSILLCAALLFSTAPAVPALAADEGMDDADTGTQVGTLSVCGGSLGEDFNYDEETHVLTIEDGADLTISGETEKEQIVVKGRAQLTLDGVHISLPNEEDVVGYEDETDANAGSGAIALDLNASLTLTLSGENTLQSGHGRAGIFVPASASLIINGKGSLDVTGGDKAAGIGGDLWHNAGAITIKSGSITATGGADSAGIGGAHANDGLSRKYGGFDSITINGGDVTATADGNAAAIGTGCWAKNGGTITINDANVSASTPGTAGVCAAIGHGYNGGQNLTTPCSIAIDGSIVTVDNVHGDAIATGGSTNPTLNCLIFEDSVGTVHGTWTVSEDMTIEKGQTLMVPHDGVLTIAEDVTLANQGVLVAYGAVNGGGKIDNKGVMTGDFSGVTIEGAPTLSSISYLDAEGEQQTCSTFSLLSDETTTWSAGWYVALGAVTIDQRVTTSGDVHLILADGATLTINGGINVADDDNNLNTASANSLNVYSQSVGEKMGRLKATGNEKQSGIGGGKSQFGGAITINGGDVYAQGGYESAGIGGGDNGAGGIITINGGSVEALGASFGAGIGGGLQDSGGTITITGGTVTAIGSFYGGEEWSSAGIGDGGTHGGTFSTGDNGHAVIFAVSGGEDAQAISDQSSKENWRGVIFEENAGQVYGDQELTADLTIGTGQTLTIPSNVTFTVPENVILLNHGTIIGEVNGTVHQADAADQWASDAENHWHPCAVEGCTEASHRFNTAEHAFENGKCTICGHLESYTITVKDSENGTVTASPMTSTVGETVSLTVDPAEGYHFAGWTITPEDLTITGENGSYTFVMPAQDVTIQAMFEKDAVEPDPDPEEPEEPDPEEPDEPSQPSTPVHPSGPDDDKPGVEVTEPEHGTVTVDKEDSEAGETVTITPTPDDSYEVDEVIVRDEDGDEIAVTDNGDGSWSYEQPDGDVTIEVTFTDHATTPVSEIFIDVAPDAWYTGAVQFAYDRGLMTGTGADTFSPDATTTRAMIVAILHRLEEEPAAAAGTTFDDVAADAWYADAVAWAADAGIVNGYSAHAFGPNDAITREQLAAILMNYSAWKGEDTSARADLSTYSDAASVSTWAADAMEWAVAEGLLKGVTADTLEPQSPATRAQVAAILQRTLER